MDILTKGKTKLKEYIIYALLLVSVGLLVVLQAIDALTSTDILITLAAIMVLSAAALLLRRFGLACYAFIPAILLLGVVSYVSTTLISLGAFTWSSETNDLLQIFGLLWVVSLLLFLYSLIGRLMPATIAGGAVSILFGIANYAMVQFRGRLLLIGDVTAIRTAANVADNYSLEISSVFVLAIMLEIICCLLVIFMGNNIGIIPSRRWRLVSRAVVLLPALAYVIAVFGGGIIEASGIMVTWNENDYEESPVLNFVASVEQLNVDEPEGYSAEALNKITSSVENETASGEIRPHIIVVMDEAFSDLTTIGDFETSKKVTPFIDSLTENTVRGYVYSSVLGGGTANSEFEFLTGSSMAFIPKGSSPYQQYIKYEKDTLVSVLESQGYSTMALHPYYASGWNREEVYNCFGFDGVHFIDDFISRSYLRNYVTDKCDFATLMKLFEEREENERMFIFNITMQNHGSYKSENYESTVSIVGHEGEFPQAEQYLTLLHESDAALKGLIDYFSQQEEPVIVLFFGDHQPDLEDEFYDMLYEKNSDNLTTEELQRRYLTPFFIWANFDIEEADVGLTSINYLSPMLLEAAGLESSDYQAFLLELQKEWPAINVNGYVNSAGRFFEADNSEAVSSESIQNYRKLQYNFLFDTSGYLTDFFGME